MRASSLVRDVTIRASTQGVNETARALEDLTRANQGVTKEWVQQERQALSVERRLESLQRRLDVNYRGAQLYARAERDLSAARDQNRISEQRHQELLGMAAQRYGIAARGASVLATANDNAAKSIGLARHEMINFSRQMQDVGTMLAMGQSPMAVITSQAAQIADIFASTQGTVRGFLGQVGGGIARFATSGLGVAAGGAAAGAWGAFAASNYASGQRDIENALRGVGAASGVTLAQINRLADGQASAARVSVSSAREILAAYAGTGRVNVNRLDGLVDFTRQYAAFTNQDTGAAAQEFGKALADPAKNAELLAEKLGGLDSTTLRLIQSQQAAGNLLGAQTTLLQTFRGQVDGATERTGMFARAWDAAGRAISNADNALGQFLVGERTAEAQLEAARRRRAALVGGFDQTLAPDRSALPRMDAEIRRLEAIVDLDRQRAAIEERAAKAQTAGRTASAISDRLNPFETEMRGLRQQQFELENAMRLSPRSAEYDAWARSLESVKTAIGNLLPAAERERQIGELNVRQIQARTLADRIAIETDRQRLELTRGLINAEEAKARAIAATTVLQAQANRDAQDALRASQDALALAGKTGAARFAEEQRIRLRDNAERFGSVSESGALPETAQAMRGMDAAFAANLNRLFKEFPGLGLTSGFRTIEEQAKLYREKPHLAAPPGRSRHESGLAADLNYNGSGQLPQHIRDRAAAYGIHFPLANRARNPEPWHAEPIGGRGSLGGATAASAINDNFAAAREREVLSTTIGNANRELERQEQLLRLQQQSWGQSTAEVARAAKEQELINALQREFGTVSPAMLAQVEATAAGYGRLAAQTEALRSSQEAWRTVGDLGRDTLRGIYSDIRNSVSGVEMMTRAFDRLADKLMDMALNDLFGKAFGNNSSGLFGSGGFLSSLLRGIGGSSYNFGGTSGGSYSYGAGGYTGQGPFFSSGGYTGPGGINEPRGIVHAGEVIWSQADVRRAGGVAVVEGMRRGYAGYASGGPVGARPYMPPMPAANQNGGRPIVNVINASGQPVEQRENSDGSLDVIIGMVEGALAERMAHNRGSMAKMIPLRRPLIG